MGNISDPEKDENFIPWKDLEESTEKGRLDDLPIEMVVHIISFLDLRDEVVLRQVCKTINDAFEHPYMVNYYETQRNHLLGKYRNLYDKIDTGIFTHIHKKPNSSNDYLRDLRILRNPKLFCWGNHHRGICGVGEPRRDIYLAPEQVMFPKGERIWFISHTYEYLAFVIMLSGRCYSWGQQPACQSREALSNSCFEPLECKKLNEALDLKDEIPIFSSVGHSFVGVLTDKGSAYYIRGGDVEEVDTKGLFIERLICTQYHLHFMYHKKEESEEDYGNNVYVGVKYGYISPRMSGGKGDESISIEEYSIQLRKNEVITKMDGGFQDIDVIFLTSKNRMFFNQKENGITESKYIDNVMDFAASQRLYGILNTNGELYGLPKRGGMNANNNYGVFGTLLPPKKENVMDAFRKCDVGVRNIKFVKISNGCDYSKGGYTLLMDEEGKLYHLGCNVHGERMEKPDRSDHPTIKLLPLKNVLMFSANENYSAVIVFE